MEIYKKVSIWAMIMSALFLFGPALSFAADDYGSEIDKG